MYKRQVLASDVSSTAGNAESGGIALADMFTDRDMEIGYDEETSTRITLSGDGASCSSDAVSISGSTVTITDEGTYIFSGETLDGMITCLLYTSGQGEGLYNKGFYDYFPRHGYRVVPADL